MWTKNREYILSYIHPICWSEEFKQYWVTKPDKRVKDTKLTLGQKTRRKKSSPYFYFPEWQIPRLMILKKEFTVHQHYRARDCQTDTSQKVFRLISTRLIEHNGFLIQLELLIDEIPPQSICLTGNLYLHNSIPPPHQTHLIPI